MIRGPRRFRALGGTVSLVVMGVVCSCPAAAAERPSGKKTPDRSLRSTTDTQPLPIDSSVMRMRIETREGVLVVYDAAAFPEVGDGPAVRDGCSGYLGYWLSARDKVQYIFPAVLQEAGDLGMVLLALESDLGVDLEALADTDDRVDRALSALAEAPDEEIVWEPATLHRAVEIMGFDADDEPTLADDPSDGGVATPCAPCAASLPPPENCGSPGGLAREALAVTAGCCGGGGVGDPPGPCTGPCCASSDPCCGSTNPCCPGCCGDRDCDGVPNSTDPDIDGDGIPNGSDSDVDGDGIPNGSDPDVDGDGTLNGSDSDVNNDNIGNGGDSDVDGDGIGNGSDPDVDGDGIPNPEDPDDDGDGTPDPDDPEPGGCTTDCPGACCTKATGACASKKEGECTGTDKYFKGKEVPCSPNPCCAIGTNPWFTPSSATISRVPPTWLWTSCLNGATAAERIEGSDVDISAACRMSPSLPNETEWCAVLTRLNGQYSEEWRLLPEQTEVTGPLGNTTPANYCAQVTELGAFGDCPGVWYKEVAVKAHEDTHRLRLEPALENKAPDIEPSIEALCVPHTPGKTQTTAVQEIRNLLAFQDRVDESYRSWRDEFTRLTDTVYHDHSDGGPCEMAELAIVDPWIVGICNHALNQCWAECPTCPPRPTGACCNTTSGTCAIKNRCDCEADGGSYQGNDETDACGPPNPCVGACCPNGIGVGPNYPCTLTAPSGCPGPFGGLGTVCAPGSCRPPG